MGDEATADGDVAARGEATAPPGAPGGGGSHVVVMGVSGSGKSTVGIPLARHLDAVFIEGDALHPPENVAKMAAGHPLDDADRRPWLAVVGRRLADTGTAGGVAACSALARRYRDQLRRACPDAWFLHLQAERELVAARVAARPDHFMPVTLVDSQLAALEPLRDDEAGLRVSAGTPPEQVVALVVAALAARGTTGTARS